MSQSEKPNIPTWYETFRSLNHDARCSNWSPSEKSKRVSDSIQKPTSTSETSSAKDPVARPSGKTKDASAPATGRKMRIVASQASTSAHRDEDDDEDGEPACERERVGPDEACLD